MTQNSLSTKAQNPKQNQKQSKKQNKKSSLLRHTLGSRTRMENARKFSPSGRCVLHPNTKGRNSAKY